jgi:hypothetical protein
MSKPLGTPPWPGRLSFPCSTGKYCENLDFWPFEYRVDAAKPLMFLQTARQIP